MLLLLFVLFAVILHEDHVFGGVVGLTKFLRTRKPIGDAPSSWWPAKPGPSLSARAKRQDNGNTAGKSQDKEIKDEGPIVIGQRKRSGKRDDDDGNGQNTKFPTGYLPPSKSTLFTSLLLTQCTLPILLCLSLGLEHPEGPYRVDHVCIDMNQVIASLPSVSHIASDYHNS